MTGVEPSGSRSGGDPHRMTPWTLIRASHAVVRRVTETLAPVGLTPTQFGVLAQLAASPGVSQAELARRVLVTPQALGQLLASLERLGHVARTPGRPGTATSVALTPRGTAAMAAAVPLLDALDAATSLGLTEAEATQLDALLTRVIHASPPGAADGVGGAGEPHR